MKTMFRTRAILRIAGFIALAAVIGFSMIACGDDDFGPNLSLNGVWVIIADFEFHIEDSTGIVTKEQTTDPLLLDAVKKGYSGVGTQLYRNLKSSGHLTWTGQESFIRYNSGAPTVATGVNWRDISITMAADGKSITRTMASGSGSITFYRK